MTTPFTTRRSWLSAMSAGMARAAASARRPNLVFLMSDQQSSDMLGCSGNEQIITPNLDRFASEGVRFRHCISNSPVCTPFRGILMTGRHGLYTGAISNDYQMVPGGGNYFGEVLRDHGYRMGYIGKWHLYGGDRRRPIPPGPYRYGFDHTFLSNNCTLDFRAGHAYYWDAEGQKAVYDDWEPYGQARQANQFIDENAGRPFALFVSWHPPHSWMGGYGAPEELLAKYDADKIRVRPACENTAEHRASYRGHMAMCTSIDIAFGRIVDKLRERGLLDNTIVVFTADHGDMLFSRGSAKQKAHPTADSCRVPLLMRWPKALKPRASDLLVGTLDLMPTLLGLMGLPVPNACHGRNLEAAVRTAKDDAVEEVPLFLQISPWGDWRGIYTRQHTYAFERPGLPTVDPDHFNRLYDRAADPHEVRNLFDSPGSKSLREHLHARTLSWMDRFKDRYVPFRQIAEAVLVNPEEARSENIGRPGGSGRLKGRPIDLIGLLLGVFLLCGAARAAAPAVRPADRVCVQGEQLKLTAVTPRKYSSGTVLLGLSAGTNGRIPAAGALDPKSLTLRKGSTVLEEGKDYLLDPEWGTLGLAKDSRATAGDTLTAGYCFSLLRLDSLVRFPDGRESLVPGESRVTRPEPPALPGEARRVANIFVPYASDGSNAELFPVEEGPDRAVTATTPGRIPRTMEKLKSGGPVKIVCWGDSVTVGGDASGPETRYPAVFEHMLRERFPGARLAVQTVAVGATNSRHWLYPDKYPVRRPDAPQIRWERIPEAKPDLVMIEFVNDAGLKPEEVRQVYGDILARLRAMGAEVILITPHFTRMDMMGFRTLRDREQRPYVLALREFASENKVALADASARWEHLWKEGIPYVTLLNNGINHPDDRGHRLFAEELVKCFAPPSM